MKPATAHLPRFRSFVCLSVLVCFTGQLALAPVVFAAGPAAPPTAAAMGGEAVLSYQGGKLPAELVALAADKAVVKRRVKALYALVLLRLAHVFVRNKGQTPANSEVSQALGPLAHESLADVALDMGEFLAASIIAKTTETILLKKYPATTFPSKMLTKVKAAGPVFTAWAVVNGVEAQVREGLWKDGFKWSLIQDLAMRAGKELLTLVAVTAALKVAGYPFALLGKLASEKMLTRFATLRIVTSTVGVWASRALTFANAAGWIVLALTIFYPMAEKAYATEEVRQLRRLAGQQVRYRSQLVDLMMSGRGETAASRLTGMDARILASAYLSDKDPFAPSKYELLVQLGDANNQFVEEKLKEMKSLLLESRKDPERKPGTVARRQKRIDELKGEIRQIFGNGKATFLDLDGLDTIGEPDALKRELTKLQGVQREAGNMVSIPPELDELVRRTETLTEKNLESRRGEYLGASRGAERTGRDQTYTRWAQERVDAVRGLVEEELVSLKAYCQRRLAQIQKLTTQFPTEGEAAAEAMIGEASFEALGEMAGGQPGNGGAQGNVDFGGLER